MSGSELLKVQRLNIVLGWLSRLVAVLIVYDPARRKSHPIPHTDVR